MSEGAKLASVLSPHRSGSDNVRDREPSRVCSAPPSPARVHRQSSTRRCIRCGKRRGRCGCRWRACRPCCGNGPRKCRPLGHGCGATRDGVRVRNAARIPLPARPAWSAVDGPPRPHRHRPGAWRRQTTMWKTRWLGIRAAGSQGGFLAAPNHGFLGAPNHASGCPELRPASANKPLGRLWPAIPALFSTQVNKGYTITRAWPDGKGAVDVKPMMAGEATAAAIWVPRATLLDVFATAAASAGADLRYGTAVGREQAGSAFGQLALRRLLSAPDHASDCSELRPASANRPEGRAGRPYRACFRLRHSGRLPQQGRGRRARAGHARRRLGARAPPRARVRRPRLARAQHAAPVERRRRELRSGRVAVGLVRPELQDAAGASVLRDA